MRRHFLHSHHGAKRFLAICLLLCACVPTPEEDYVVGKMPTEATISQTLPVDSSEAVKAVPTADTDCIPIDKGKLSEIRFEAALEHMDVESCPVYPLTPVSFDGETVERLIRAFVPDVHILVGEGDMTLADIEAEIAATLSHINGIDSFTFDSEEDKAQYLAEEQEILEELQDAYRKAQQTEIAEIDASTLAAQERVNFALCDTSGHTVARGRLTCGIEDGDPRSSHCHIWRTDDDSLTVGEQDAASLQPICEAFLKTAGIEGFAFNDSERRGDNLRQMYYTRTFPALPYAAAYQITSLQWRDYDDGALFTEPAWSDESILLQCKNRQVVSTEWVSKSEIGDAVQEVPILSYDVLKQKIVDGLIYQWSIPQADAEESHRITVTRVQLGYKRVQTPNAKGKYRLIPVCTAIGYITIKYRSQTDASQRILDEHMEWTEDSGVLLVLNAIDGSIVG